jgi:antitoxin (DNA-binding transcriptional repressor) of toxin-antitoxin stability system
MQTIDSEQINLPPSLLDCLQKGETIVVEKQRHPFAFIVPAHPDNKTRPVGLCEGEFTVPDDFNDPLPEIEALFYGENS